MRGTAVSILWVSVLLETAVLAETGVPAWNARGVNLLPWQGVACLDVAADGSLIAVGTIAPAGDPNVIVISGDGQVLRELSAGQRWIGQVAIDGSKRVHALCTTPAGRSGDGPTVFACDESATEIPNTMGEPAYPRTVFFYGDHSNHSGVQLLSGDQGNAAIYGNQVLWLGNRNASVNLPWPLEGVATAFAAHPSGAVVAGYSALISKDSPEANLFLADPGDKQPRWKRLAVTDVGASQPPEKGLYGTPTLPDGTRQELPQHDLPVTAPLSIAVDREPVLHRVAAADYRGWQRWIRSSATLREQNYGTRFMPAPPTVTVYDAQGMPLRRFGPEAFGRSCWVDLSFLPGGKQLIAFPHHWTCRGLAGQPFLPVDDDANVLWLLDVETGEVSSLQFPDAIASAAVGDADRLAVSCWNGRLYLLTAGQAATNELPSGADLGGPALVHQLGAQGWVAATAAGTIHFLDAEGRTRQAIDLNRAISRPDKSWVAQAKAERIDEGLWQLPGGRVESDLGGQRVIEGPDGLVLIEGHAGLSFEREWRALEAAGLDPYRVKYVLATHEHGDHAPGAYLWRVTTGAQFVCSEEMAYTLQHHIPLSTGYGLHPPVPTDVRIRDDQNLDLAGVSVRALRLPGHTYGSMGWLVERGGKKYVALGDLIMPDGVLGYAGSINFSARDVLASLRKLEAARVDYVLPGHGPITGPERYVTQGISVGRHVGWGKTRPEAPDPRYRLHQENVLVAAWNLDQTSADFGDLNGDGRPDVAVVVPKGAGAAVKMFLNQSGKFAAEPDVEIPVPDVPDPSKLRARDLNSDGRLDLFVGGRASALLLSQGAFPAFETTAIGVGEGNQARRIELETAGDAAIVVNARFGAFVRVGPRMDGAAQTAEIQPKYTGPYVDVWSGDVNGDGRADLVYSYGQVYLRGSDGRLPVEPTLDLAPTGKGEWCYFAVGDFNGDGHSDLAFFSMPRDLPHARVHYQTGETFAPYRLEPDLELDLSDPSGGKNQAPYLRDTVVVADWNGDGADDLVIGKGQDNAVLIIPGGPGGLDPARQERIALDYRLHYETGLYVGDFNGDGKADLASLGYTNTGVGAGGPLAVYIYLQ